MRQRWWRQDGRRRCCRVGHCCCGSHDDRLITHSISISPAATTAMAIICHGVDLFGRHELRPFRSTHCPCQEPPPMLTHGRAAVAPRRAPPSLPPQPPEPWAALLDSLGAIEDEEHILVLGRDGPDLMCALLRAGAPQVTHVCSYERLETGSASLVLVPHVPSLDCLESALSLIRRALLANGRLAVCIDSLPTTQNRVRRMVTLHGFTAIRASRAAGRQVLSAEVPAF